MASPTHSASARLAGGCVGHAREVHPAPQNLVDLFTDGLLLAERKAVLMSATKIAMWRRIGAALELPNEDVEALLSPLVEQNPLIVQTPLLMLVWRRSRSCRCAKPAPTAQPNNLKTERARQFL